MLGPGQERLWTRQLVLLVSEINPFVSHSAFVTSANSGGHHNWMRHELPEVESNWRWWSAVEGTRGVSHEPDVGDVAAGSLLRHRSGFARPRVGPDHGWLVQHSGQQLAGAADGLGAHGGVLAGGLPGRASASGGPAGRGGGDRVGRRGHVLRSEDSGGRLTAGALAGGRGVLAGLPADAGSAGCRSAPPRARDS